MNVERLTDLLHHELKDLYSAESQIVDHLPDMIEKASDDELRAALQQHLEETRHQKERIEKAGEILGVDVTGHRCKGIAGILSEGSDLVKEHADDDQVRDAAIVGSAQRVEHYEIAGYGTARTYAIMLDHDDVAELLSRTLDEEKNADRKLTTIAEDHVNRQAAAA